MSGLEAQLLAAHDAQDLPSLVGLYGLAAKQAADDDARAFFLTHAYVFALELGDARAPDLYQQLKHLGRV